MTAAAPTPTPPPAYTPVEPSSSIQDAGSLPKEDLLALLSHYRGPSDDLKGLSVDDLQVLLSYHKSKITGGIRLKREREDGTDAVADVKRSKPEPEAIVIEDDER
ncbi:hypothetical protein N0V87_006823 [Didymella glomerata]|uniref:Uncharacterized protein n=1 Tax=Didymella glomerata TaxID=749621 RepID=A0A9W9BYF7_9PLEO|nr:hypothetical protein N0V87_006823 [Didymella glomerata]